MTTKRIRRTEEQLISDLEAKIASLQQRAARKAVKANPTTRYTTQAIRSIDKALEAAEDATARTALQEARGTLSALLAVDGVVMTNRSPKRRAGGGVDTEALLAHIKAHPGQRGEGIAAALGTTTGAMRPVMKKLIESKQVKTKGQRRGMTYAAT